MVVFINYTVIIITGAFVSGRSLNRTYNSSLNRTYK